MGKVYLSQNIRKTSERIDTSGNVINPRTKQIIAAKEPEYIPPPQPTPDAPGCHIEIVKPTSDPMDIQEQIKQAEANLEKLKEAKRVKIEEMEKQLNELKKQ